MREDTLCWSCQRATSDRLCPWAGGEAVDGWEAEPTVLTNYMGGKQYNTNSFKVNKCPLYIQDWKQTTIADIARLIDIPVGKAERASTKALRTMLKEKGLDLRTVMQKYLRNGKWAIRRLCYTKPLE